MKKNSREQVAEAFEQGYSTKFDKKKLWEDGQCVGTQYRIDFFVDVDGKSVSVAEAFVDEINPEKDHLFVFLEESGNGDYNTLAVNLGFVNYIYKIYEEMRGHFPCNKHQRVFDKMMKNIDEYGDCIYYLRKLYVKPEYRGLGIGQTFIEDIAYILYDCLCDDEIILTLQAGPYEIDADNEPKRYSEWKQKLIRFYRKCGFVHVGEGTCIKILKIEC